MNQKKILVLGGGLAGLAAAEILSNDYKVIILEKSSFIGGLAGSFKEEDNYIPNFYHHIIASNGITRKYLNKYNLLEDCKWKRVKVVIGEDGKIYDISNPLGLLRFKPLSVTGRLRFGLFALYTIFLMRPEKIADGLDAKKWLYSVAGKEVTDKIFTNLYAKNKFNISLEKISAKQLAYRLKEREVYDKFTYPKKGLHKLVEGLEKDITKNGGKIKKNCAITKIDLKNKKVYTNKGNFESDIIISTIPIPELLKVEYGLPHEYRQKMSKVKYCPAIGVVFGTEDFLNKKFYWINLFNEKVHIIIQHSILLDSYSSKVNWCLRYGGSDEDFRLTDGAIKERYLGVIKKYFPKIKVKWAKVFREKYAEPIYNKDYINYKPDYITPFKGFYMAGIQVTYPKIRNMNTALLSGIEVSQVIKEDLLKGIV